MKNSKDHGCFIMKIVEMRCTKQPEINQSGCSKKINISRIKAHIADL